ncbi:M56 family metallopeptidase [Nocardioides hungaricus]
MTWLAGGAGYLVLTTVLAPLVLTRGTWPVWHPRLALALWHAALLSCAVALVATVLQLLSLAAGVLSEDPAPAAGWSATWVALAGWPAMFAAGAVAARLLATSEPVVRAKAASREDLNDLLSGQPHALELVGDLEVRTIDDERPVAASVRLPQPTVLVTTGLRRRLTAAQLAAVLEHERAHLDQRHHLVRLVAAVATTCLPRFVPAVELDRATRLLIELIADDTAARRCGTPAVIGALEVLARTGGDAGAGARADRLRTSAGRRAAPAAA